MYFEPTEGPVSKIQGNLVLRIQRIQRSLLLKRRLLFSLTLSHPLSLSKTLNLMQSGSVNTPDTRPPRGIILRQVPVLLLCSGPVPE
jgi:hypothetical protein